MAELQSGVTELRASCAKGVVAFQGEPGAFSHAAAFKLAGTDFDIKPVPTFRDLFESLRLGQADWAVVPIENTLHGSVHENYDHLLEYDFQIVGETTVRIAHQLIALPELALEEIRDVLSHPVALNQCKRLFLQYPHLRPVPFYDTAGSVKHLREKKPHFTAAIASVHAAEMYGGHILLSNIEDSSKNFTRFFLLAKQAISGREVSHECKTSLVFSLDNSAGSLFRALACFALRNVNMTKIESRPLRDKPWEYLFYLDVYGDARETNILNAIANLTEYTRFVKVLGSYQPVR